MNDILKQVFIFILDDDSTFVIDNVRYILTDFYNTPIRINDIEANNIYDGRIWINIYDSDHAAYHDLNRNTYYDYKSEQFLTNLIVLYYRNSKIDNFLSCEEQHLNNDI